MRFHIPFTIYSPEILKRKSASRKLLFSRRMYNGLQNELASADAGLSSAEYLTICVHNLPFVFFAVYIFSTTLLVVLGAGMPFLISLGIAFLAAVFVFIIQLIYPKVYNSRRQRDIERNLIPALSDIHVQLTSGVPLFSILVNISSSDYGALSDEFNKAVKKIHAGFPESEVLEELGESNKSPFFRRALWQISNGMRAGSDIAIIIKESIRSLSEEQLIQIQNYGNKLNPLIMFYMLISVILPALSITFLTVLSSLIQLPQSTTFFLFSGMFAGVIFLQVMFLGIMKSLRPSLL